MTSNHFCSAFFIGLSLPLNIKGFILKNSVKALNFSFWQIYSSFCFVGNIFFFPRASVCYHRVWSWQAKPVLWSDPWAFHSPSPSLLFLKELKFSFQLKPLCILESHSQDTIQSFSHIYLIYTNINR